MRWGGLGCILVQRERERERDKFLILLMFKNSSPNKKIIILSVCFLPCAVRRNHGHVCNNSRRRRSPNTASPNPPVMKAISDTFTDDHNHKERRENLVKKPATDNKRQNLCV